MRNLFIITLLLLFTTAVTANNRLADIRDTLKWIESNHNPQVIGDGGASYGILQIKEIAIKDVNLKYGTNYKHEDAFNVKCAEEIFSLYIQMWVDNFKKKEGREATIEDIVRIWNGGPNGYKKKSTIKYYKKYLNYKKNRYLCDMKENKQKCTIDGKLGIITNRYTHTVDVYLFKSKRHMVGVHRRYVKLLPQQKKPINPAQLVINYDT